MRSVPAGLPVPVGRRGGRGAATRDSCPCLRVRQHDRLLRNSGSYCSAPRRPSPLRTVSAARARSRDNRDGFGDQCAPHCAERPRFLAARDSYTGANARPHRSAARACAGAAAHAARRPLRCSPRARSLWAVASRSLFRPALRFSPSLSSHQRAPIPQETTLDEQPRACRSELCPGASCASAQPIVGQGCRASGPTTGPSLGPTETVCWQ